MFLNEGFVMMRHVSPFFAKLRDKVMKKLGDKLWWRLHGTLDWLWIIISNLWTNSQLSQSFTYNGISNFLDTRLVDILLTSVDY